ncbi:UNVERIFIED_CONTAM: hypothetical protein PYX00_010222 [Menopon gallinae]
MIKRFNQHSIMVLKACERNSKDGHTGFITSDGMLAVENNPHPKTNTTNEVEDSPAKKKVRLQEKITYDDLSRDDSQENVPSKNLQLTKVERYLHGPMPSGMPDTSVDLMAISNKLVRESELWTVYKKQVTPSLVSPAHAVSVLGELTPGGALMKGFQEESLAQLVPRDLETELKYIYTAACQLLRHFWCCFPPTTKALEEKAVNVHASLHRFELAKLKPFEDKVIRELNPLSHHLTSHINEMLQMAYRKYNTWQARMHR